MGIYKHKKNCLHLALMPRMSNKYFYLSHTNYRYFLNTQYAKKDVHWERERWKKGWKDEEIPFCTNFTTQICQYLYVKNIHGLIALSVRLRSWNVRLTFPGRSWALKVRKSTRFSLCFKTSVTFLRQLITCRLLLIFTGIHGFRAKFEVIFKIMS